jgi:hypothetical protein
MPVRHASYGLAAAVQQIDNGAMMKGTMLTERAVMVRNSAEAIAAAQAAATHAVALTIVSPPGAALFAGPVWFLALARAARATINERAATVTFVLDCADSPGAALSAIRAGVEAISFRGRGRARERLAALAKRAGVSFRTPPAHVFDMTRSPDTDALIAWFSSPGASLQTPRRSAKRTATQSPAPTSRGSRARYQSTGANRP